MKKIILSVENTTDISDEELDKWSVRRININVLNVTTGEENPNLTITEFYDKIRHGNVFKTSLINEQEFFNYFSELAKEGDVLHLAFTGGLSGTAKCAKDAAERVNEQGPNKVYVVDTLTGSGAQAIILREVIRKMDEGMGIEDLVKFAEELKTHTMLLFTPEDLKTLAKSGRCSKILAVLGTILQIKPIIYCNNEGKFAMKQKVISRKKALMRLVELFKENYNFTSPYVYILHGDKLADAEYIRDEIKKDSRFKDCEFCINYLGTVVGAHGGPGNLCLCFTAKTR